MKIDNSVSAEEFMKAENGKGKISSCVRPVTHGATMMMRRKLIEIGRASCRERV